MQDMQRRAACQCRSGGRSPRGILFISPVSRVRGPRRLAVACIGNGLHAGRGSALFKALGCTGVASHASTPPLPPCTARCLWAPVPDRSAEAAVRRAARAAPPVDPRAGMRPAGERWRGPGRRAAARLWVTATVARGTRGAGRPPPVRAPGGVERVPRVQAKAGQHNAPVARNRADNGRATLSSLPVVAASVVLVLPGI